MNLQSIRDNLNQKKGQANQIKSDLKNAEQSCEEIEKEISYSEKAQIIIQTVAQKTQNELSYRITEPVSLALAAVYENPYKMVADFQITGKGNTECHLGFERNGNIVKPVDKFGGSTGGGPIDIGSFALRIGSLCLAQPRPRPILITDEPFRFLDKEKAKGSEITTMHLAGQFLRELTKPPPKGLGLQIIMISHAKELMDAADRIIRTKKDLNDISTVEVV